MQYDTYGVMQNVSSGNSPDLGLRISAGFILSRYNHGTGSRLKGCGLVENRTKKSRNLSEKSGERSLCFEGFSAHPAGLRTHNDLADSKSRICLRFCVGLMENN